MILEPDPLREPRGVKTESNKKFRVLKGWIPVRVRVSRRRANSISRYDAARRLWNLATAQRRVKWKAVSFDLHQLSCENLTTILIGER
jgi:hypothetical protein